MSGSTAARLAAGLLTFTVMARFLGPEPFGVLMYWLSVAALLSLVSNFGLTTYLLREMGAQPGHPSALLNEMWTSKFILTVLLLLGCGLALPFFARYGQPHHLCLSGHRHDAGNLSRHAQRRLSRRKSL